tara:strand:+ start:7505 stop:7978 length:474 start_codon:yes stop_codon:yes gene_type:complete
MWNYIRKKKQAYRQKIVDEVRQEMIEDIESHLKRVQGQLESYVTDKVNHMEIDYEVMVGHLDYYDVANCLDYCEVADNLDHHHIAQEIDVDDISRNLDVYDVAQNICHYEVAENLDLDDIATRVSSNLDLDTMNEELLDMVDDKINEALDDLEITRG